MHANAALGDAMAEAKAKTVLICDDEPYIIEAISYLVEKAGYHCIQARDGAEALARVRAERPSLIIVDVGMPGMTGFELCERLRAEPAHADVRIVILTAFGQAMDECKAYEVGADVFMRKPFSPHELREMLHQMLD